MIERLLDPTRRFFASPIRGSAVGLFRIAFGLLALRMAADVGLNAERYYSSEGVVDWSVVARSPARWTVFALAPEATWLPWAVFAAFASAAVLYTIGLAPRVAAFVLYALMVSLQHRTPFIFNSGDRLFVILAAFSVFLPLDRRWSLAARRRGARGDALESDSAPGIWSTRLLQLQIAYLYLATGFDKLGSQRWLEGMGLRDVLASPVYAEWPTFWNVIPLVNAMTWGTIAFELGFPLLFWFKRFRPWALAAGVAFHAAIDVLMVIPMFSAVMIVSYALLLDDDEAEALVEKMKRPFARRRS